MFDAPLTKLKSYFASIKRDYRLFTDFDASIPRVSSPATPVLVNQGYVYPQEICSHSISESLKQGSRVDFTSTVYLKTELGLKRQKEVRLLGHFLIT